MYENNSLKNVLLRSESKSLFAKINELRSKTLI